MHFWNCGAKHEPLVPFFLPSNTEADDLFLHSYPLRVSKGAMKGEIVCLMKMLSAHICACTRLGMTDK